MLKEKPCAHCGRTMQWRKKWEKSWDDVKYCSDRCRKLKKKSDSPDYEAAILALLQKRSITSTICPSEVLTPIEKSDKEKMERVREAARRLVHMGKIEILQKGQVVDPSEFRGPIRLRLKR